MKSFTVATLLGAAAAAPQYIGIAPLMLADEISLAAAPVMADTVNIAVPVASPRVVQDLWSFATAGFTQGADYNSTVAQNAGLAGTYQVQVTDLAVNYPGRTVYAPINVANGTRVPAVIWTNGNAFKFGAMYETFLKEIASHGYLVIAPGSPATRLQADRTNQRFITDSIDQVLRDRWTSFAIDKTKIAVAGHGLGGYQATEVMAWDDAAHVTTGLFFNTQGSNSSIENFSTPSLWVSGGTADLANSAASFQNLVINDKFIPSYHATLQTGSRGTFWQPRGGAYAEIAVKWLDLWLKKDESALAAFPEAQISTTTVRGWTVDSNAFPAQQRNTSPSQSN